LAAAASPPDRRGRIGRVYAAAEGQGVPGGTSMSAHRRAQESHGYGRTRGVDDGQSLVCLSRKGPLKKSAGLEAAHQPHVRPTHHKRAPPGDPHKSSHSEIHRERGRFTYLHRRIQQAKRLHGDSGGGRGRHDRRGLARTRRPPQGPRNGGEQCDSTPSQPTPVGGKAGQTVPPGSPVGEYPPRKETPKSTHARPRPGEDTPSDKHELCDRKITCPGRRPRGDTHASPSYPLHTPSVLLQPSGKIPSDTLREPSETLPSGPMGPVSAEDGRSFGHRLELGRGKGAT